MDGCSSSNVGKDVGAGEGGSGGVVGGHGFGRGGGEGFAGGRKYLSRPDACRLLEGIE